jgi:hypothetical protein
VGRRTRGTAVPTEEQTYREFVKEKLRSIDLQTKVTNGKVRKIIIALAVLTGIVIGQNFASWHDIIVLLASAV